MKTILIIAAIWLVIIVGLIWFISRTRHPARRARDLEDENAFSHLVGRPDDGYPGGPRGVVWNNKQRAEYQRDRQRRKLRVIQ